MALTWDVRGLGSVSRVRGYRRAGARSEDAEPVIGQMGWRNTCLRLACAPACKWGAVLVAEIGSSCHSEGVALFAFGDCGLPASATSSHGRPDTGLDTAW